MKGEVGRVEILGENDPHQTLRRTCLGCSKSSKGSMWLEKNKQGGGRSGRKCLGEAAGAQVEP